MVCVPDGTATPPAPAVVPVEGWQLAGWDWQATVRGDPPATTARCEEAAPGWTVDLVLAGTEPATLTFGMQTGATDGWDEGVDVQYPPPATGQACLTSDDPILPHATDLRAPAGFGECLLIVNAAADTPASVSCDVSGLPAGKCLSIHEVLLDGVAPSRDPVAMELVGNTARDMDLVHSLEVSAGHVRSHVIRYGNDLAFDLLLRPGWNLISLPVEPTPAAVELIFADGLARERNAELRDGLRGTIHGGSVWTAAGTCAGWRWREHLPTIPIWWAFPGPGIRLACATSRCCGSFSAQGTG